jgi:hypothetical protein
MGKGLLVVALLLLLILGPIMFLNVVAGVLKLFLIVVLVMLIVGLLFGGLRPSRRHVEQPGSRRS